MIRRLRVGRPLLCFVISVIAISTVATLRKIGFAPKSVPSASRQPNENQLGLIPKVLALDGLSRPVSAQSGVCAPYGNPIDGSKYKGSNSFALCTEGDPVNVLGHYNGTRELRIACNSASRRSGWKWHIWCTSDGGACNCNQKDFNNGHANWSAGDHCTLNGEARPGQNGCAAW